MSFFHSRDIHDCVQCMPWRSFPFWEDYGWCNQSLQADSMMGRTGFGCRYKMLSCLWTLWEEMGLACLSVISYTQSSAEWLLVLGGNGPWVSDFEFLFTTARVHINPKHALTHCHLSFKEQFNTSKAHILHIHILWGFWDEFLFQINDRT